MVYYIYIYIYNLERGYDRPLSQLLTELHKRIIEREIVEGANNGVIDLNIKYLCDHMHESKNGKSRINIANDLLVNQKFKMSIYSDIINRCLEYKKNATPFWLACLYGRESIFRYFELLHPVVNSSDLNNNTCLHVAIQNGNIYIIMRLLDLDCNCSIINNNGWSTLMLACYKQMPDVAERIFLV